MPRPQRHGFSLHVHISVMLAVLLLLAGAALGLFNYLQTSQIILSSSGKLFSQIEQDVQADLRQTYQPIRHLLNLLALGPDNTHTTLEQRLVLLPPFAQALSDNPQLASLYLGYSDGDFFMVRPLRDDRLKATLGAPAQAAYQVWSIDRSSQQLPRSQSLYFDAALTLLERRENPEERYDPRQRVWFGSAKGEQQQVTTAPYVFFSSRQVGTTLARRVNAEVVLGADLTLADLSATLARHVITADTQIVLYSPDGSAVAYPDSSKLLPHGNEAQLVKARELTPELSLLLAHPGAHGDRLRVGKRDWVVASSDVAMGGPQGLRLALLVPEDQLLADAYRLRWQGALITLGALLLCVPLAWLSSRLLVRPLRRMRQQAEAMRAFDFSQPPANACTVLEIDHLNQAMQQMRLTLAQFFQASALLRGEATGQALLQQLLVQATSLSQAQAGILYCIGADNARLEPRGLIIDGLRYQPAAFSLRGHLPGTSNDAPWLGALQAPHHSHVSNVGFDNAAGLGPLMLELDSPRVDIIAIALHDSKGATLGLLLLVHRDTGARADLNNLSAGSIALIKALCEVATARIGHECVAL